MITAGVLFFNSGQSPNAVDEMIDMENKLMAENLATKVTRLKSVG